MDQIIKCNHGLLENAMQESDLKFDTIDSYLTSTSRKTFIFLIFIWMMSWSLCGTIVNATIQGQVHPPPLQATPVKIHNYFGNDVHVLCTGWPQRHGLDNRVIHQTIPHRIVWYIDYGRDILQERLFCEVVNYEREWNCFVTFAIPYMCMWENPQLAVARANMPSPESCPVCNTRNVEGDIQCAWHVDPEGIHLLHWNSHTDANVLEQKATWTELPEAFDGMAAEQTFHLSFSNYFEDPVILDCGERGNFRIRAYRRGLGAMRRMWVVRVAAPGRDSRWLCSVTVETSDGTWWTRTAIVLWDSPVGYKPDDGDREPPCIDCAWSMKEGGLWVDRRGCGDNEPQWEKRLSFRTPSAITRQVGS